MSDREQEMRGWIQEREGLHRGMRWVALGTAIAERVPELLAELDRVRKELEIERVTNECHRGELDRDDIEINQLKTVIARFDDVRRRLIGGGGVEAAQWLAALESAGYELAQMEADLTAAREREAGLRAEVCKVFVWDEERQIVEERDYDGETCLHPDAWPAITAAVRAALAREDGVP